MVIGTLALTGFPLTAGYFSKDAIIEAAYVGKNSMAIYAFILTVIAAGLTAFYSWRLIFMTFHGRPRADEKVMAHIHESPAIMISPLVILATGAIFAGAFFYNPFVAGEHETAPATAHGHEAEAQDHEEHASVWNYDAFWGSSLKVLPENNTLQAAHHVPEWVKLLPTVMGVTGILLAWVVYIWRVGIAARIAALAGPLHRLFFRKWYFDEIYDAVFVENAWRIGQVFSLKGDRRIIDGYGPDGVALVSQNTGAAAGRFQSGYLYHYAFVMMLGLVALVSWFVFRTGVQ
jgi:NADH-quinone oxidoreductase subunit L